MWRSPRTAWILLSAVLCTIAGACTDSPSTTTSSPTTTTPAPATTVITAPVTTAPAPPRALPGYEVTGVPAGWVRTVELQEGISYRIQYQEAVKNRDPVAEVEAHGRRISFIVTADPDGRTQTLGSGYPGHPATVAGVPATVFETAPPPGGRHGVDWRANGFVFGLYAYMDEPQLLRLAATVRPTGRPVER